MSAFAAGAASSRPTGSSWLLHAGRAVGLRVASREAGRRCYGAIATQLCGADASRRSLSLSPLIPFPGPRPRIRDTFLLAVPPAAPALRATCPGRSTCHGHTPPIYRVRGAHGPCLVPWPGAAAQPPRAPRTGTAGAPRRLSPQPTRGAAVCRRPAVIRAAAGQPPPPRSPRILDQLRLQWSLVKSKRSNVI